MLWYASIMTTTFAWLPKNIMPHCNFNYAFFDLNPYCICSRFCFTSSAEGLYRVIRPAVGEASRYLLHHFPNNFLLYYRFQNTSNLDRVHFFYSS